MRYLYICPTCKKAYSAESDRPDTIHECLVCNSRLIYANCSKDEWDKKTEEDKKVIKETVLQEQAKVEMSTEGQLLYYMKNLDKNVSTIKSILVFFTVLFVICAVITLILAAKSAALYNDLMDGIRYGF
jgi:DNA-directed RNA polymerase subunit RPC12/RpoP